MVYHTGIMNTKQRMNEMEFFSFYLDAWKFCKDNHIDLSNVRRYDWATWVVEFDKNVKV